MPLNVTTTPPTNISAGAGLDILTEQNALTVAAVATGVTTLGGAAFVATAVAPSWVIGGSLMTAGLAGAGHLKSTTGSYLPFLKKDEDNAPASTPDAAGPVVQPAA